MVELAGNGIIGLMWMAVGIFLPAIGHKFCGYAIVNEFTQSFLNGISAVMIGMLGLTTFTVVRLRTAHNPIYQSNQQSSLASSELEGQLQ